jgi:predicted SAM-dependent methyltransferase
MARKIELGAGINSRSGFLHCDIRLLKNVDIVCSSLFLPFKNDSVEEIYLRHHLEHFTDKEATVVLNEAYRILKQNGTIYIIVPNIDYHIWQFYHGNQKWAMAGFWGWQNNDYDIHKWGYNFELLKEKLKKSGFINIKNFTAIHGSIEKDEKHLEVRGEKI